MSTPCNPCNNLQYGKAPPITVRWPPVDRAHGRVPLRQSYRAGNAYGSGAGVSVPTLS